MLPIAKITIEIKSSDEMTETQVNAVICAVDNVDWDVLAEGGLRCAGVGEAVLDQLTFDYDQ